MIPTTYKDKLPKHLVYPFNAKVLSNALQDVRHYDDLKLHFSRTTYEHQSQHGLKYVEAKYTNINMGLCTPNNNMDNMYGPRWDVHIYAITNDMHTNVNTILRNEGLNTLCHWLSESRTDTWLTSSHHCTLYCCPIKHSINTVTT